MMSHHYEAEKDTIIMNIILVLPTKMMSNSKSQKLLHVNCYKQYMISIFTFCCNVRYT